MFLFIGGPEIVVIVLIVVMLFGADKIPEIARTLGKTMRQVKDATNEIKREINESAEGTPIGDVKKEIDGVKEDIDDLKGPIKRQF